MNFLWMAFRDDRCALPQRYGGHALGWGGPVWEDALGRRGWGGADALGGACWLLGVSADE